MLHCELSLYIIATSTKISGCALETHPNAVAKTVLTILTIFPKGPIFLSTNANYV